MKDRRKILLGTKDVVPKENKDLYLNLEIYSSPDELQTEIVNNNFNLRDQFNDERRRSLKFCIYGTLDCITADLDDVELKIKTNHEDLLYMPRIEANAKAGIFNVVKTKPLSQNNYLSKNIFKKNKSSFCFIFELAPGIKNFGETKILEIKINDISKNLYANIDVPFLFFDDDGNLVDFGTDTVDIDLNGEEQIIENDFPFLYGTHWIKQEISLPRPLLLSFRRSELSDIDNLTVEERSGKAKFVVALDAPSIYGIEETEVFVQKKEAKNNPNEDYVFEPKKLSWAIGEQFKTITIDIIDDLYTEDDERVVFGFRKSKYLKLSDKDTFTLTIKNDDAPSIVSFENGFAKIVSDEMGVKTYLQTDKPVKVPNQSVDIVLDNENSTIILGEDIENTGSENYPEYRQNIPLKQGLDIFEIEIKTKDNLKYDLTKNAIFKLENGTQNIKPEEDSEFNLEIEDSMVTRYTKYLIDSDRKRGQGVFRLDTPVPTNPGKAISFINTKQFTTPATENTVTPNFSYTLEVINDGETMIYNNRVYDSGDTVASISSNNGYENFSFTLPSNIKLNEQNKYFEKSKYKFKISDIQPTAGFAFAPLDPTALSNNTFNDFEIISRKLKSSLDKSGTTYYLTSEMSGVMTRLKYTGGGNDEITKIYDLIVRAGIKSTDGNITIKNKLKDTGEFDNPNFGINTEALNQARSRVDLYKDQYPDLTPPESVFEVLTKVYGFIIRADIDKADSKLTIRQKLRETGEFNISGGVDNSALVKMTDKVKSYIENNPNMEPPSDTLSGDYVVTPVVTTDEIDCKINGLLLLSKIYTGAGGVANNFFNNSAFGGNVANENANAKVKVTNVLFKEEPVKYTYFTGEVDGSLFNLMPVEPIKG